MKFKTIAALLVVSLGLLGCATIVGGGSTQEVNFDSNPAGAQIFVGRLVKGKVTDLVNTGKVTPHSLTIPRRNAVVILKKEGYEDTNVILKKTINGWVFGNIIIGGLLGMSIDSSTGAVNKYDPHNFLLELQPVAQADDSAPVEEASE